MGLLDEFHVYPGCATEKNGSTAVGPFPGYLSWVAFAGRRPTLVGVSEQKQQPSPPSKDPLHGKTLERILNELVEYFGWPELGEQVAINCFRQDPSIASSLKFLRRTPWARAKVESLYLFMLREQARAQRRSLAP